MAGTYTSHFGINNIPYGIARSSKRSAPQAVTRIGDEVIFLAELSKQAPLAEISANLSSIFAEKTLNTFAAQPKNVHVQTRAAIQEAYKNSLHKEYSEDIKDVELLLPVQVGDFTDFSVSRDHVTNAPKALFGKPQLPHTFHNFPLGYAGRCSSIYVSPTPVTRPIGQFLENGKATFGASRALDYELEVGAIVGRPLAGDADIYAKDMDEHIFGLVLVNDWSSRDIQGCEMRDPLGPFKGKNFGTSVSPWVVTLEALKVFEAPAPAHEEPVVTFLDDPNSTSYNLTIEAEIVRKGSTTTVCKVAFAQTMYWTFRQMLAHNAIGGCPLNTGDLLASGTVSGPSESELACLMELTMNGKEPKKLSDGSDLRYLEDGDTVRFTAVAGDSSAGVGFGECIGTVKPARLF
ncbi:hypothetical protein PMIN06_005188 [Paraphaeosphaeria minitans]|uniref:Fumarylacetoacetase n=1 Tax=Paraphaeosphaeria minitans TaxID=565426 RepID=A0A9P6GDY4_9PLEO|nr:fumarylacetoacetate hydrolase [Paraphaeosphaeria minitans]